MKLNHALTGAACAAPAFFTHGRLALMAVVLLQTTVLSAAGSWSTAASACTIDESSLGKFSVSNAELKFAAGQTGQVVARCNITNPLDSGGDPKWNFMQVTYVDPDGAGANQVVVALRRVDLATGSPLTIATFDSNGYGGSSSVQSKLRSFSHAFNFLSYVYFLEITLTRPTALAGNDPALYRVNLFYLGL